MRAPERGAGGDALLAHEGGAVLGPGAHLLGRLLDGGEHGLGALHLREKVGELGLDEALAFDHALDEGLHFRALRVRRLRRRRGGERGERGGEAGEEQGSHVTCSSRTRRRSRATPWALGRAP